MARSDCMLQPPSGSEHAEPRVEQVVEPPSGDDRLCVNESMENQSVYQVQKHVCRHLVVNGGSAG